MKRATHFSNRFLTALLIFILGALAFALPVSAEGLGQALPFGELEIKGPLALELIIAKDGSWVANATLQGVQLRTSAKTAAAVKLGEIKLEEQSPESLGETFKQMGMQLVVPPMDPSMVSMMVDMGVQQAALRERSMEGYQQLDVYINNQLLLSLQLSDAIVDTAVKTAGVPQEQMGLVQMARDMDEVTVVFRFPLEGKAQATSFADEIKPIAASPMNVIQVGATVANGDGRTKVVSLAGISSKEIESVIQQMMPGVMMPDLMTTIFADLGLKEVQAKLGANGLEVDAGADGWMKVLWDKQSRGVLYEYLPAVTKVLGVYLPIDLKMLPMIEDLLATSEVDVSLYVADMGKESLPKIQLGRPVLVQIGKDGAVNVAGMPVGMMALGGLAQYMPVAAKIDGADMEIRFAIQGGVQMPYLYIAKGGVASVAPKFLAVDLPWDKVEGIIEGIDVSVFIVPEGMAIPDVNLDYAAQKVDMLLPRLVPRVAVDSKGHIGVGEPPLRISGFVEEFGIPIEQMTWPWVAAYGKPGDLAAVVVDNNTIQISMNNQPVGGIRWDPKLRANVVGLFPIPELPFGVGNMFPDWKTQLTELLVRARWGVELKVAEQEIPPSGFEGYLKDIRGFLPF